MAFLVAGVIGPVGIKWIIGGRVSGWFVEIRFSISALFAERNVNGMVGYNVREERKLKG